MQPVHESAQARVYRGGAPGAGALQGAATEAGPAAAGARSHTQGHVVAVRLPECPGPAVPAAAPAVGACMLCSSKARHVEKKGLVQMTLATCPPCR